MSNPTALVAAINNVVEIAIAYYGLPPVARKFARFWILLAFGKLINYVKDERRVQVQEERQLVHDDIPVLPPLLPPGSQERDLGVVLTDEDVWNAKEHAERQQAKAIREQRKNALGHSRSMAAEITGALGEIAVAKCLGLFWQRDLHGFKMPDVAGYQIRATDRSNGQLIVRDNDGDGDLFILVSGFDKTWTIRGWISGKDAKTVGKFEARGRSTVKCWWVSLKQLNPLSSLPDLRTFQDARPFPAIDEEDF